MGKPLWRGPWIGNAEPIVPPVTIRLQASGNAVHNMGGTWPPEWGLESTWANGGTNIYGSASLLCDYHADQPDPDFPKTTAEVAIGFYLEAPDGGASGAITDLKCGLAGSLDNTDATAGYLRIFEAAIGYNPGHWNHTQFANPFLGQTPPLGLDFYAAAGASNSTPEECSGVGYQSLYGTNLVGRDIQDIILARVGLTIRWGCQQHGKVASVSFTDFYVDVTYQP